MFLNVKETPLGCKNPWSQRNSCKRTDVFMYTFGSPSVDYFQSNEFS